MVYLDRIYTRSGDQGETSLGDGTRVSKTSDRVVAMGSVDELNAIIGMSVASGDCTAEISDCLRRVQNLLFDLGADLCLPLTILESGNRPLRIENGVVQWLEFRIDEFNSQLEPLTSFVLPGGTKTAAHLHLARTVCRRAEIDALRLSESETINPAVTMFLNRLSDLLFVMARCCNLFAGHNDVLWRHGGQHD